MADHRQEPRGRGRSAAESTPVPDPGKGQGPAFDEIPAGLYVTTADGRFLNVNPALVEMFRMPDRETFLGTPVPWFYVRPTDRDAFLEALRQHGRVDGYETELKRYDGTTVWAAHSARAEFDARGEIVAIHGAIQDMTGHHLLQQQLRHAQKMEAVGRLAGGVAHDFNNIITAIQGYANLIKTELDAGSPAYQDVEEILRSAERATGLTRQLMTFSRPQPQELKQVELNELVRDMLSMLRRMVGADIAMGFTPSDDRLVVAADPGQLEQVLANLVVNARDAMPEGGTLDLRLDIVALDRDRAARLRGAQPGTFACLSVRDDGAGIEEEAMRRIFEPFFTTKARGKGTGLGLSIVFGIVQQAGGFVHVDSEPGLGTCFQVHLPLSASAAAEADRRSPVAVDKDVQGGETVLVVDDEEALRGLTARVLKRFGYRVLTAGSAEEAMATLEEANDAVDVVLADVGLPDLRGPELCRRVAHRWPDVRVLLTSGDPGAAGPADADGEMEEIPFLEKPFSSTELARQIRGVLRDEPPATS